MGWSVCTGLPYIATKGVEIYLCEYTSAEFQHKWADKIRQFDYPTKVAVAATWLAILFPGTANEVTSYVIKGMVMKPSIRVYYYTKYAALRAYYNSKYYYLLYKYRIKKRFAVKVFTPKSPDLLPGGVKGWTPTLRAPLPGVDPQMPLVEPQPQMPLVEPQPQMPLVEPQPPVPGPGLDPISQIIWEKIKYIFWG